MASYVALLRGINVGGKVMVAMADLREMFEAEGFSNAKTLLQSGNVVFEGKTATPATLEAKLEKAAAKKFGRKIDFVVRDAAAWNRIIEDNPFLKEAKADPGHLLVVCLKSEPSATARDSLKAASTGGEYFEAGKGCLYIVFPNGIGRSKLGSAMTDKKLGTVGTARNWNTVQKISALMES